MNPSLISSAKVLPGTLKKKKSSLVEIFIRRGNIFYKWECESLYKGQKERTSQSGIGDGSEWTWLDSGGGALALFRVRTDGLGCGRSLMRALKHTLIRQYQAGPIGPSNNSY